MDQLREQAAEGSCPGCSGSFPLERLNKCSRCLEIRYCGRKCQKQHWPAHKLSCEKPGVRVDAFMKSLGENGDEEYEPCRRIMGKYRRKGPGFIWLRNTITNEDTWEENELKHATPEALLSELQDPDSSSSTTASTSIVYVSLKDLESFQAAWEESSIFNDLLIYVLETFREHVDYNPNFVVVLAAMVAQPGNNDTKKLKFSGFECLRNDDQGERPGHILWSIGEDRKVTTMVPAYHNFSYKLNGTDAFAACRNIISRMSYTGDGIIWLRNIFRPNEDTFTLDDYSSLTPDVLLSSLEASVSSNLADPSPGASKLPAVYIPAQKLSTMKSQVLLEHMLWFLMTGAANFITEPRIVLGFFLTEVPPQYTSTNVVSHSSERATAISLFAMPRKPLDSDPRVEIIGGKRESDGISLCFSDRSNGNMSTLRVTRFVNGQLGAIGINMDMATNSAQVSLAA